jgi:hypothetical protein
MANRALPDYLPADWPDNAYIPTREEWDVAGRIAHRQASIRGNEEASRPHRDP